MLLNQGMILISNNTSCCIALAGCLDCSSICYTESQFLYMINVTVYLYPQWVRMLQAGTLIQLVIAKGLFICIGVFNW
jgi:hypothetical protein